MVKIADDDGKKLMSVSQMAKYLETVYVSGWQCSSTASTSNEPGPDLADYPMDTVPNKVLPP
jgi:isocitrate lyase